MKRKLPSVLLLLVLAALAAWHGGGLFSPGGVPAGTGRGGSFDAPEKSSPGQPTDVDRDADRAESTVGFRSRRALDEHFEKHGREFGAITKDEYLRRAQLLRDARVGGRVLEIVRADGVHTRFDTETGAFLAFDRDRVIRTFFKPNDGVRYFERQAEKEHE